MAVIDCKFPYSILELLQRGTKECRPAGKSKLDERNDEINGELEKGLNLTAISKLIDRYRQTLANWFAVHKSEMKKIAS